MTIDIKSTVLNVCSSPKKGVQKTPVEMITLRERHGVVGDAHAGNWHRQVSILANESAETIRAKDVDIGPGDFGENILTLGCDLSSLTVGDRIGIGNAVLEVTQIGKACHTRCAIFEAAGTCVMPKQGVFCRVLKGGEVYPGDTVHIIQS